jgi:hypothetical protein
MHFTILRPQKKKSKARRGGGLSSACAMGAFIGFHGQKCINKTRIWLGLRFKDYQSLTLNMMLQRESKKL